MQKWAQKQTGFTIVELLIVVVVIAILAAITIVGFNGIQNRAKESAAHSTASQAAKKLASYAVTNSEVFPATETAFLTAAGLSEGNGISYEYRSAAPNTSYCLTTTVNSISYYTTNTNQNPVKGGCAGHSQNGVAAITNLAVNPSFEAGSAGIAFNLNTTTGVTTVETNGGFSGNNYLRRTFTPASNGVNVGPYQQVAGLSEDKSYYLRVSVRSNAAVSYRIIAERRNSSNASVGSLSGTTVAIPGDNSWRQLELQVPPTPTMDRLTFTVYSASSAWSDGTTVDYDGFFLTEGAGPYNFADGNSANWVWNGTVNASTSTGPAL